MSDFGRQNLHRVLANVLVPLARTLLRLGVTFSEFSEISKRAFVKAAMTDHGVRDRNISVARIAVLTGLSRKEARRMRDSLETSPVEIVSSMSLPAEVLEAWYVTPAYCDQSGAPRPLGRKGRNSFSTIVRSITADISPAAVERELLKAGAIRTVSRNQLLPTSREYIPFGGAEKAINGIQFGLRRLTESICRNSDPRNIRRPIFERVVYLDGVDAGDVRLVRESLGGVLEDFSVSLNDQMASFVSRRRSSKREGRDHRTIGVGLYYFDDEEP